MSQENVDVVRSMHAAAGAEMVPLFRDDEIYASVVEALGDTFSPELECANVMPGESAADSKVYRGADGLRELWLDWLEPWESYRTGDHEFFDLSDRVLVLARDTGRSRLADVEVAVPIGSLWTVRGGVIVRVEFYSQQDQALVAAGVRRDGNAVIPA